MKRFVLIVCLILVVLFTAVPVSALSTTTISGDSITSISPAADPKGTTVTVTIIGVNFTINSGDVWLERSGENNIDASAITWSTSGTDAGRKIVCKLKPSSSRETGKWNVVVQKSDGTLVVGTGLFAVTDAIDITSINPTTARINNDSVDFTIAGTGLSDISDVYLYNVDLTNITADNVDAVSDTKVKGTFDMTDADKGTYKVCVVDTNDVTICDLSFSVTAKQAVGSIDISSKPSGATIYVDGTQSGTTPDTIDELSDGSHKITLKKSGYEDWIKTVTVISGETTDVSATLNTAYAQATPTPTPNPTPIPTAVPKTTRTTVKSTLKVPTTWADVPTTTAASPLDPVIVIGAAGLGIGLVVLRRR
jgi:hypothetical protein